MPILEKFKDFDTHVKDKWFESYLRDMVRWGVFNGFEDNTIRPDEAVTRAQLAAVFHRMIMSQPAVVMAQEAMKNVVYITDGSIVGSGFWLPGWKVVTNHHVAFTHPTGDPRSRLYVYGFPGVGFSKTEAMTAVVDVHDASNDLAVLQVTKPPYMDMQPSAIMDFADVEQGQQVWALGNPFGYPFDICSGIVRSKERKVHVWAGWQDVYALDVPINPGNSGGLAIDAQGRCVGVPNAGSFGYNAYTYMIPTAKLLDLINPKK